MKYNKLPWGMCRAQCNTAAQWLERLDTKLELPDWTVVVISINLHSYTKVIVLVDTLKQLDVK